MPSRMKYVSTPTDNHGGLSLQSARIMNNQTRKPNRLQTYDYSRAGYYFVTICTHNRVNYFGEIDKDQMKLSNIGQIATECWQQISEHFDDTALDEFVVMPNHIHGIIILVGDADLRPLQQQTADRSGMYLSKIIHGFKSSVSRNVKRRWKDQIFAWQRSFYDHVIRTDESLDDIRSYIKNNPLNWASDEENTANQTT